METLEKLVREYCHQMKNREILAQTGKKAFLKEREEHFDWIMGYIKDPKQGYYRI